MQSIHAESPQLTNGKGMYSVQKRSYTSHLTQYPQAEDKQKQEKTP
jgi:hypothetical protein